jgi:AraC-like DNA-binding protein
MDNPVNFFNPNHGKDQGRSPVSGRAADFSHGFRVPLHSHPTAQLIHAVQGVMVVSTEAGQWIVPPTRGLWMPTGMRHQMRMVGEVQLRTLYFRADAAKNLPNQCQVVGISPLLRELILSALDIAQPCDPESRDGRLMRLVQDEVAVLPSLPLRLPYPTDPGLLTICARLTDRPDDPSTLSDWSEKLGVHAKTIERRFLRQTGLTFGQWRQQARLIMALERLACGEKVVDVALGLGYNSPSAFATMFRQQFGAPPSTYFRKGPSRS